MSHLPEIPEGKYTISYQNPSSATRYHVANNGTSGLYGSTNASDAVVLTVNKLYDVKGMITLSFTDSSTEPPQVYTVSNNGNFGLYGTSSASAAIGIGTSAIQADGSGYVCFLYQGQLLENNIYDTQATTGIGLRSNTSASGTVFLFSPA